MMYRVILVLAYVWVLIYTASYGVCDFKEKNKKGTLGLGLLCIAFTIMTLMAIL